MLKRLIIFLAFLISISITKGEIIALSGVYEGINLYVQNDSVEGTTCVKDVFVNDQRIEFEKDKHFFEIDMSFLKLKEQVSIKIICTSGCKANVLNPEAINLMYGFQFMSLIIEEDKMKWMSTNEKSGGKYFIELLVHKQWVPIGELPGSASKIVNIYEKKIIVIKHCYYRIKYLDKEGIPHSSMPIKFHKH